MGIFGYAAGKSFNDGWARAAGIPTALFPSDTYELVLQGLSLKTPWLYVAVGIVMLIVIFSSIFFLDTFQERRNNLIRHRRKAYESYWSRYNRNSRAKKARVEYPKGIAFEKWRALGSRGHWIKVKNMQILRAQRVFPYTKIAASLFLQLAAIAILVIFYFFIKNIIMRPASTEGAQEYIGMYAAVTGKRPSQFSISDIEPYFLKELACKGRNELRKYRTVKIATEKNEASLPSSDTGNYVLKGTDKIFLLLNTSGSTVRSFGGNSFDLKESDLRPISDIVKSCHYS
ncbi:hypothetical protein ACIQW9_01085 [Herminiimonas sp. NPDC097707]|uniref:hypothetical protein n=1 Tax=Herminiimonas sp. NPDC097707 TaxID=3364007 RepID=UPI003839DA79